MVLFYFFANLFNVCLQDSWVLISVSASSLLQHHKSYCLRKTLPCTHEGVRVKKANNENSLTSRIKVFPDHTLRTSALSQPHNTYALSFGATPLGLPLGMGARPIFNVHSFMKPSLTPLPTGWENTLLLWTLKPFVFDFFWVTRHFLLCMAVICGHFLSLCSSVRNCISLTHRLYIVGIHRKHLFD